MCVKKFFLYPLVTFLFTVVFLAMNTSTTEASTSITPISEEISPQVIGGMTLLTKYKTYENYRTINLIRYDYDKVYKDYSYNPNYTRTKKTKNISTIGDILISVSRYQTTITYRFY